MSTGLEADPPEGISRDSECHGSASEVAGKATALRQALIEGENSGKANDLDIEKIKATARQRSSG